MAGKDEIMSMEKEHSRKLATEEASESTRTHDLQSLEEAYKLSISIQKKVTPGDECSLADKFQRLTESYARSKERPVKAKIQKVPFPLRGHKHFKKYFEPRAVALGPIHHGKPGSELGEEYKTTLAAYFIKESDCDEHKMYNAVEKDIKNLRECYEDEVTKCYDDKELAWMLFLDGSSLLGFITCNVEGKLEEMNVKKDRAAFGQQDIFLLENQLPWRLLQLLIHQSTKNKEKSTKNKEKWINNIHGFIDEVQNHTITLSKGGKEKSSVKVNQTTSLISDDCPHLLHLLRKRLLGDQNAQKLNDDLPDESSSGKTTRRQTSSSSSNLGNKSNGDIRVNVQDDVKCCMPVSMTRESYLSRNLCKPTTNSDNKPTTFRNIKELKSAGIRVRPSDSSCLTQIDFRCDMICFPTLYLPSIVVDDWTAPKFLNLVAYEMCPDFFNDFGITSYVCFLDSLIDQPEDVKDLRDADILYNVLGSDEEVATLFNEISTDLVLDEDAYSDVKKKIQIHYNRAWTKWVALGYHKHFSNPWTLFALLGALLGLALSFIQAWTALDDSCTKICPA